MHGYVIRITFIHRIEHNKVTNLNGAQAIEQAWFCANEVADRRKQLQYQGTLKWVLKVFTNPCKKTRISKRLVNDQFGKVIVTDNHGKVARRQNGNAIA